MVERILMRAVMAGERSNQAMQRMTLNRSRSIGVTALDPRRSLPSGSVDECALLLTLRAAVYVMAWQSVPFTGRAAFPLTDDFHIQPAATRALASGR